MQLTSFPNYLVSICSFLELKSDHIKLFLVANPKDRSTASECLQHPWLTHIGLTDGLRYTLYFTEKFINNNFSEKEHWTTLETAWMRGILARRRWHRWFLAINAMHRMRRLSLS